MSRSLIVLVCFLCVAATRAEQPLTVPPYIKQCYEGDPNLIDCYKSSLDHLRPYLAKGIPEIEVPTVEPFLIGELSLSLITGPNGYKVTLKNITVLGASNYTVESIKLSEGDKPFEAKIKIPELRINARYTSSGLFIILPASGNGQFNGVFDGVTAIVRGKVTTSIKDGLKYLHVKSLTVELIIKNVQMAVKKIFNNNRILIDATNLFLRENGQEVIKAMNPQLTKSLASLFKNISNKLLTHVPVQMFLVPKDQQ